MIALRAAAIAAHFVGDALARSQGCLEVSAKKMAQRREIVVTRIGDLGVLHLVSLVRQGRRVAVQPAHRRQAPLGVRMARIARQATREEASAESAKLLKALGISKANIASTLCPTTRLAPDVSSWLALAAVGITVPGSVWASRAASAYTTLVRSSFF